VDSGGQDRRRSAPYDSADRGAALLRCMCGRWLRAERRAQDADHVSDIVRMPRRDDLTSGVFKACRAGRGGSQGYPVVCRMGTKNARTPGVHHSCHQPPGCLAPPAQ
jgi:hypothetical protein